MDSFYCIGVDISEIKSGDTILHNGSITTVDEKYIKNYLFMGTTIFGDSYNLGTKKVIKMILIKKNKFNFCRNCSFKAYLDDDIIFCNNIKSKYYDNEVSLSFLCDKYAQG